AAIRSIAWRDGAVLVDGSVRVMPRTPPSGFGAAAFEQGGVMRHLAQGRIPPHAEIVDAFGCASGALCWELDVPPAAGREVEVAVPFAARAVVGPLTAVGKGEAGPTSPGEAVRYWARKVRHVHLQAGADGSAWLQTLRTATAHILVSRDGPALQPGPRRY